MKEKTKMICIKVCPEEIEGIHKRMELAGARNMSAYLLKMALNGYISTLDLPEINEMFRLSSIIEELINFFSRMPTLKLSSQEMVLSMAIFLIWCSSVSNRNQMGVALPLLSVIASICMGIFTGVSSPILVRSFNFLIPITNVRLIWY